MKAIAAENDTIKEVRTHDIFLLNSVVCLEDDWKKPFEFIEDIIKDIKRFIYKQEDDLYECDDPKLKLSLDKIET